jgi:hypothetical protein
MSVPILQSVKQVSPYGHVERSMSLLTRTKPQNGGHPQRYLLFVIALGYGRQVGRWSLQELHCGAVAFTIHSMAHGAVILVHLFAGARLTLVLRDVPPDQFLVGPLRRTSTLANDEDSKS